MSLILPVLIWSLVGVRSCAALESQLDHNGSGWRKASFLKVKVYQAKLFLESPTKLASEVIQSRQAKRLELTFERATSSEQMQQAWQQGFIKNNQLTDALQAQLNQLKRITPAVEKADVLNFVFDYPQGKPAKLTLSLNGVRAGSVEGEELIPAVLRIWFGPNPPNEALKAGMLGRLTQTDHG